MNPSCILCGTETKRIVHPTFGDYHSCPKCEFISKDERHLLSEKEEVTIYNYHENSIDDPKYVEFFYKFLNDAVFPYVKKEEVRGLDFGSGPSPVLSQLLGRYHGYDMDIYDLYYAPEKVYEGKIYDLITTTEVVEHLRNPMAYFRLFAKLLKPGGVLAVMTLFHLNDEAAFLDWHYIRDHTHISFYTPKTMNYIASQVGLKVIYTNDVRYTTFVLDKQKF